MNFHYTAKDKKGKNQKGVLNAMDKGDALSQLLARGLTATSLSSEGKKASRSGSLWDMEIGSGDIHKLKIKKKKLLTLFNQLSIMLKAGVSLATIFEVLIGTEKNKSMLKILNEINTDLYTGVPLSVAMSKFAAFPEMSINIIESGEANGRLDVAFARAAVIIEKEIALAGKIKGAMAYPIFLLILTLGLIIIMSVVVLPTFADVFTQFGADMPALTLAVMAFSDFLITRWYVVVGGVVLLTATFLIVKKKCKPFRIFLARSALKIPLIGVLLHQSYISRFCRIMSSLVEAGVDIIKTLEISRDVLQNLYMKEQLNNVIADVRIGSAINQSMAKYPVFDPLLVSMVRVGEESGLLFETMAKMSDLYEQQTDESTKKLTSMLEPAMTVVIAVVVGTIIISIVIPMFSMYGVISGG